MDTPVTCSFCGHTFEIYADRVGQHVNCPVCSQEFVGQPSAVTTAQPNPLMQQPEPEALSILDELRRIDAPPHKLYTPGAALLATFLGGPMGGFVILAVNYARLGRGGPVVYCLLAGLVATLAALYVAIAFPENALVMVSFIPQMLVVFGLAKALQGKLVDHHVLIGGKKASNWAAAGIGLLCMVPTMAAAVGLGMVMPPYPGQCVTIAPQQEIYVSEGATEEDARKLGLYFQQSGYFNGVDPVAVQLTKPNGTLTLTVDLGWLGGVGDAKVIREYQDFRGQINTNVFPGQRFVIRLRDEFGKVHRELK